MQMCLRSVVCFVVDGTQVKVGFQGAESTFKKHAAKVGIFFSDIIFFDYQLVSDHCKALKNRMPYFRHVQKCNKYKSRYFVVVAHYKGMPVKLFYIKYKKSMHWSLLQRTTILLPLREKYRRCSWHKLPDFEANQWS